MIDLLVAGGGPIGLAAAIEARLAGLAVVVVEPRVAPIDKACGEGLMPGAIVALERLGVEPPGHALAGIRYLGGGASADHRFRKRAGRGVRRTRLHEALLHRATELGVEQVRGRVVGLEQHAESVTVEIDSGMPLTARWVFGCDGLHSGIRSLVGLQLAASAPRRFGVRRHYALPPWSDLVEVHWTSGAELYVTPVGEREVGVAVLGSPPLDFEAAVAAAPVLASRLMGAPALTGIRGAGPLRQRARQPRSGRVLLVGDASGYVDAITGEGIRIGLAQARAAVECVVANRPDAYAREWRRVTRDFRMLTSSLVRLGDSPLRPAIVPLASSLPRLYGSIVERLAR